MSTASRVIDRLKTELSFQISVDTDSLPLGLTVAEAALAAGVDLVEMGTPLLKTEGVRHVVPAFRARFPNALLLADMKTMDGGGFEARSVFEGGGNIIDFLAIAGEASARNICAVRDEYRRANPELPRLVFADILLPHQGPAGVAIEVALRMLDAGVDGIGAHLQLDARRADPSLFHTSSAPCTARSAPSPRYRWSAASTSSRPSRWPRPASAPSSSAATSVSPTPRPATPARPARSSSTSPPSSPA